MIDKKQLNIQKMKSVTVLVYQLTADFDKTWEKRSNKLYYFKKEALNFIEDCINKVLEIAIEVDANLIVFPELSVPEELIENIKAWTNKNKNKIVIAGTHYKQEKNNDKPFNASPIIINGEIHFAKKKVASSLERNLIQSYDKIPVFYNTPIGNFSVIICSDYLSNDNGSFRDIIGKIDDLDFLIVVAFQPTISQHHCRLAVDVDKANGLYAVYSNNKNDKSGGESSFFHTLHKKKELPSLIDDGNTNYVPENKAISPVGDDWDYFVFTVRMDKEKNPTANDHVDLIERISFITKGAISLVHKPLKRKSDFVILSHKKYTEIKEQYFYLEHDENNFPNIINLEIIKNIKNNLDKQGISFLVAPINGGKTFITNNFEKIFKFDVFLSKIPKILITPNKDEFTSPKDIYFRWYYQIIKIVLSKNNLEFEKLEQIDIDCIYNKDNFIALLEARRASKESDLKAFIRILDELVHNITSCKGVLLVLQIDDLQEYITLDVYQKLKDEVSSYGRDIFLNKEPCIKIIVSSRYYPLKGSSLNVHLVHKLSYFNKDQILWLAGFMKEEKLNKNELEDLCELILSKTDGYPWFVINFFKQYVLIRLEEKHIYSKVHPIHLGKKIFETSELWLTEGVDDFFPKLMNLLINSSGVEKIEFNKFINTENKEMINLNNSYFESNSLLLQQSGFLNYDYDNDIIINNGTYIMQKHYKPKLSEILL